MTGKGTEAGDVKPGTARIAAKAAASGVAKPAAGTATTKPAGTATTKPAEGTQSTPAFGSGFFAGAYRKEWGHACTEWPEHHRPLYASATHPMPSMA